MILCLVVKKKIKCLNDLFSAATPTLSDQTMSVCVCVFGPDSRRVLRLLIRLGDLPVAVDHLYQQPEGQEHQQHIHHDLRVEGCGVFAGCGAQTRKNVLFSADTTSDCLSVCICVLSRVENTCFLFFLQV